MRNETSMPGFSAEAALYHAREPYHTTRTAAVSTQSGQILPQLLFGPWPNPGGYHTICHSKGGETVCVVCDEIGVCIPLNPQRI